MDCSLPGSSRILQARIPGELPFPSPGDFLGLGVDPRSLALQSDSLLVQPPGKLFVGYLLDNFFISSMESVQVFFFFLIFGEVNFLKLYFPNNPFHLGSQIYLHSVCKIVAYDFLNVFCIKLSFCYAFCMSVHPPLPLD